MTQNSDQTVLQHAASMKLMCQTEREGGRERERERERGEGKGGREKEHWQH